MKKFLATVAATVAALAPMGVKADSFEEHEYLWNTLQRVGVTTRIDDKFHCDGSIHGAYLPYQRTLIVCKDYPGGQWTANDYDTLRHEAHHVVQDCNEGVLGDGELARLFSNDDELAEFVVRSGMSRKDVAELAEDYYDDGANTHVVMIEIETFAVARAVDPRTIADKLVEFCSTRF